MSEPNILVGTDARGVATVALNRPAIHNAFDDRLIAELTAALRRLAGDAAVRVVVLAGSGESFSAGGDLNWMQRMAGYSDAENLADAMALAALLRTLNELPKPTVARVHGAAFGGGVGLVCCCDIAVAAAEAQLRHLRGAARPGARHHRPLRRGARSARARRGAISSPPNASPPPRRSASAWCTRWRRAHRSIRPSIRSSSRCSKPAPARRRAPSGSSPKCRIGRFRRR